MRRGGRIDSTRERAAQPFRLPNDDRNTVLNGDRGANCVPSTSLGSWVLLPPLLLADLVPQTTEFGIFDHEHVIGSG